jgi:hypothetical protein
MVTEDLVQLDEVRPALLQPPGEALVEICPNAFWQRVIRRVADQQVPESVGLLACELWRVRADELLPHECDQTRHRRLAVCKSLDRAVMEEVPLDRAALEHRALARVELVETRGQERLDRRRDADLCLAARGAYERVHLLEEERIPLGDRDDALTQSSFDTAEVVQELRRLPGIERLEQDGGRVPLASAPGRPLLEELGTGDAQQHDGRVTSEVGDVLDEIEQCLLGPVQIVEHAHHRTLLRVLLDELAEAPGDLLRRRRGLRLAEQRAKRHGRNALRQCVELLHDLDHGPVGDALAVRETAATHDGGVDAGEKLRGKAGLAHAG